MMSRASEILFSKMPFVSRILTAEKIIMEGGCNVTPTPLEFPNANSDLYGKQGFFPTTYGYLLNSHNIMLYAKTEEQTYENEVIIYLFIRLQDGKVNTV